MRLLLVDSENKREIIEINKNAYVSELVEKLRIQKGINGDIYLHFGGEILDENELISTYDIVENAQIIYMGVFRGGVIYKY